MTGVAGVGMSAVAQAMMDAGFNVSGSDRYLDDGRDLDVLKRLRLGGTKLSPQDGSAITPMTSGVIVSTAIEPDNPDLTTARRLNIPVIHRAEMIARLAAGKRMLAVAGTAGKTTVTGMIGHLCAVAGLDPTVINGGAVVNWEAPDRVASARKGTSDFIIVEADESDRSLLALHPCYTVITNISKDHFSLEEVTDLFRQFRARSREWSITGPQAGTLLDGCSPPALATAMRPDGRWLTWQDHAYPVPMPGQHNAENTLMAIWTGLRLGITPAVIQRALATFRGIHRRLEQVGRARDITFIDDYAHNPAKIVASWRAVAESGTPVTGIWRPHGYAPLAHMFDELVDAFASVVCPPHRLFVLPVYYAGGTAKPSRDAERLVEVLNRRGCEAHFAPSYAALSASLLDRLRPGDTVLGMGARDPELPVFLHDLVRNLTQNPS